MNRLEKFLALLTELLKLRPTSTNGGYISAYKVVVNAFGADVLNLSRGAEVLHALRSKGLVSYSKAFDEVFLTPAGEAFVAKYAVRVAA